MSKTKKEILSQVEKEVVKSKFIGNNTLEIQYKDGSKAVRLHNTDVITFTANDTIILNSGGWKTPTTKSRISANLPRGWNLYQHNYKWYLKNYDTLEQITYFDKIEIDFNQIKAKIVNPKENTEKSEKEINSIKKSVNKYIKLIDKLDKIPAPNGGDCWHCFFQIQGKGFGDKQEHLREHLKDDYLHGSIIYLALKEKGYQTPQYLMQLNAKESIKNALRSYLIKRLIKTEV